jgi:hypothetical protein
MFGPGAHIGSPLPQGQLVGNYRSYEAAIAAVDRAVEAGVDPRFLSIVGRDLRSVYRLRHRPSYAAVAGRGAIQGAFFGLFIGLLMSMLTGGQDMLLTMVSTMLLGAVIWVIFGVIGEVMRRRQLKYAMIPSMTAVSFDLVVDNAVAGQVTAALGPQSMGQPQSSTPAAPTPQPDPSESQTTAAEPSGGIRDLPDGRPQYGVRVDPKPDAEPKASDDSEPR